MKFTQYLMGLFLIMDEAGDGKGGGGAGDGKGAAGGAKSNPDVDALKAQNADLIKRLEALEKVKQDPNLKQDDGDLASKAAKQREENEKKAGETKRLEAALKFTMSSKDWFKTHAALLPKSVEGILDQAEKENYGNAVEKDEAIKAGIISEFFSQQTNLDLLTESQKNNVEEFKKLTKTDKQQRSHAIYESIFEPTFEMLKRIKKVQELGKGHANPSDAEAAYKEKLIKGSRKQYLREQ